MKLALGCEDSNDKDQLQNRLVRRSGKLQWPGGWLCSVPLTDARPNRFTATLALGAAHGQPDRGKKGLTVAISRDRTDVARFPS